MSQEESKTTESIPTKWLMGLAVACAIFLLGEFTFEAHPHVKYEGMFGFFGFAALVGMALLALASQLLRKFLQRDRGYY